MHSFYGFNDLKVGMRIQVQGRSRGGRQFEAMQVEIKHDGEMDEMEGFIDSVDADTETLSVFGIPLEVNNDTEILDLDKEPIDLDDLESGMRIKTKGMMLPEGRYRPWKLKMKTRTPDSMDELEGKIQGLDPSERTLRLMGFSVHVGDDIEIEE